MTYNSRKRYQCCMCIISVGRPHLITAFATGATSLLCIKRVTTVAFKTKFYESEFNYPVTGNRFLSIVVDSYLGPFLYFLQFPSCSWAVRWSRTVGYAVSAQLALVVVITARILLIFLFWRCFVGLFTRNKIWLADWLCSFSGDGVLICSIDNMPAQLPREATEYFGGLLMPHVHDIVRIILRNANIFTSHV